MKRSVILPLFTITLMTLGGWSWWQPATVPSPARVFAAEDGQADREQTVRPPTSLREARSRAHLLHETIHGTLQVMHRDFFREDEGLAIPSHSLEDVFSELARSQRVQLRWLVVNAEAMNVDNRAKTPFEKEAVKQLSAGRQHYEAVGDNQYQFAGTIRLSSQCLKCHLPRRTSTEDRAAGLVITMPLDDSQGE